MARWTAADMPGLGGRVAVVTGANAGLGLIVARELAGHGARTLLACRDVGKGEAAAERIRRDRPGAAVEVARLDLADLGSVREFAADVLARGEGLDLLVNNAGVMALPYRRTADGFEMQFGTNHLGHFALTGLLLPALLARPGSRVVTVSSGMHRAGRIDFDDLQSERRYRKWAAYGQSKLANLLFAFELDRRARAAGTGLKSVAAHPGYAATNLQTAGPRMAGSRLMERASALANVLVAQSAEGGALPLLYAATVPGLPSGAYVGPDGPFESRGYPRIVRTSRAARDEQVASRLWEVSARLTGVTYDFEARASSEAPDK
ncbi:oxidoreductase [Bailinhaonella thermotolerans]|uniref:SDR family NAD(P)-dependent oxidoreductase n=1 Tax=Bailinhaonella thermotolerans TaxID=1070861 RepID=A0A3A4AY65_9ACTN|nr:oxidoreductase [Bailinhaonella thermotolerans]RJL26538.1 SDR family NAD(P)-dependent oxidoreductase [Bailinhaonella thermotolerans]